MQPAPDQQPGRAGLARRGLPVLLPLSWIYAALAALDRGLRSAGRPDATTVPHIVSIGNLEVGGSGKTPLAMWLLERVLADGRTAAYVSRGYGSRSAAGVVTAILPADAAALKLAGSRVLARSHPDLAREAGDEGALVAARVPGACAFFARDKRAAVRLAAEAGIDVVVLDDGFQSWSVARHTDVVLLDAARPLANGRVLPAGPLRERPAALRRADVVVFNGIAGPDDLEDARSRVRRWIRPDARVAGLVRSTVLVAPRAGLAGVPARALLVSGIARPGQFRASVEARGAGIVAHEVFADHHRYTVADAARIAARARREKADAVVTTEKDWVKLCRFDFGVEVWRARLDVDVVGDMPL